MCVASFVGSSEGRSTVCADASKVPADAMYTTSARPTGIATPMIPNNAIFALLIVFIVPILPLAVGATLDTGRQEPGCARVKAR